MVRVTRPFVATLLMGAYVLVLAANLVPVSADGGTQIGPAPPSGQTHLTPVNPHVGFTNYCDANPCITNVIATVAYAEDGSGLYGWYMDLTWTTSENAGTIIAVSVQPATSDVDGNEFAQVDGAAIQLARTGPNHSARISHLKAASYHFIIEAIDANGMKTKYHGFYHFYASL